MTRQELKSLAKLQIKGKIGAFFVISLIIGLLSSVASSLPLVGIVASIILTPAFELGYTYICFKVASDPSYKPNLNDLFDGFRSFWPFFKVMFLQGLFTFLWTLLFIIPGYVKACAYSQALYIIAENPEMSAMDALRLSEQMMQGRKMDYFVLNLSFFGWAFLSVFTLGLLLIWLEPYMRMTMVNFYSDVKTSFNQFFYAPPMGDPNMGGTQPGYNNGGYGMQ